VLISTAVTVSTKVLWLRFRDVTCSWKEVAVSQRLSVLSYAGECSW